MFSTIVCICWLFDLWVPNYFSRLQCPKVDDSKSYALLMGTDSFFLRKLEVNCGADDDEVVDCVGGAAFEL